MNILEFKEEFPTDQSCLDNFREQREKEGYPRANAHKGLAPSRLIPIFIEKDAHARHTHDV